MLRVFLGSRKQCGYILGPILAIAVHDDDGSDVVALRDRNQSDSNRTLMAEIDRKLQHFYRFDATIFRQDCAITAQVHCGAIVDGDNNEPVPRPGKTMAYGFDYHAERNPIVQHRHDDGDAVLGAHRFVQRLASLVGSTAACPGKSP
jgi:hypothetical protein